MAIGQPSIATSRLPNDLKGVGKAVDDIRERFQNLEAEFKTLKTLVSSNTSLETIALLQRQVALLSKTVAALNLNPDVAELVSLLSQSNGIVVLKDGHLITRVLTFSDGVLVQYPDGAGGKPRIYLGSIDSLALPQQDAWDWQTDAASEPWEFL